MADKDSRTEQATPRKREKFRDEGKVAISKELVAMSVFVFAGAVLVLDPFGARKELSEAAAQLFAQLDRVEPGRAGAWLGPIIDAALAVVFPIGLAALAAALVSGFAQTKGLFNGKKLSPDLAVLNPLPKLKQMFASMQALTSLLISLGKVAAVAIVVVRAYSHELPTLQTLGRLGVGEIMAYFGAVTLKVAVQAGALLILFAIIDYVLVHYRLEQDMKMTKQEVKDEHKDMEGDPELKRRVRGKMREHAKRMMAEVPKAAVVLVNPTHYAVALRYDAAAMGAPAVVAKGKDEVAARIRAVAREHGVPVVRNPPLTRRLFSECELGDEVPPKLYGAVAEVLALIYRLRGGLIGARA